MVSAISSLRRLHNAADALSLNCLSVTSFPLPYTPRHVLIGANAHAALTAHLRARRPELDIQGAKYTDITAEQLAWADTYIGFKRPPAVATMGAIRWVHCTGAGVDSWLESPELDRGILLTRTPESFGPAIAEWAVSRILAFQQQLLAVANDQIERRWTPRDVATVAGTNAIVLGTGDVGRAVAKQLDALGVHVTGVSRTGQSAGGAFRSVHPTSELARLVPDAQWIVITLPNTPATRGLFNRDLMSHCRGAVLLNAGRGVVVEESAIPEALDNGWLRGAALDVFQTEPLPSASPLWSDPRVMISPHISGPTTLEGAADGFLECAELLARGELPRWTVDRDRGY